MPTGYQFPEFTTQRVLGAADFKDRFFDYFQGRLAESNKRAFYQTFFHPGDIGLVGDGNDQFRLNIKNDDTVGSDGLGNMLIPKQIGVAYTENIFFENANTVNYHTALKYVTVPSEIQINPFNGQPEWVGWEETCGEKANVDSVVYNGNGTFTFRVDSVTESGASNAGRKVRVYMNTLPKGATSMAIAVEELTVQWVGGQNVVTTTGMLGQTESDHVTVTGYYTAVLIGPTVKRYTDLSAAAGYCYIGTVQGAGAGSPPTVFDTSAQKFAPQFWPDVYMDGMEGDFIPKFDNTYDFGSPTNRWANFYVTNLVSGGDLVPGADDTYDLGAVGARWKDLYLSGTMYHDGTIFGTSLSLSTTASEGVLSDLVPAADSLYDLGSATRQYAWIYGDNISATNFETDWVANHLFPDADNSLDLGNSSYYWRDAYFKGTAYLNTIYPGASGALGFANDLVPTADTGVACGTGVKRWSYMFAEFVYGDAYDSILPISDDTYDLGSAAAQWKDLYIDGTANIDILALSEAAGEGFTGRFVPVADDTYDLGNGTYDWRYLYTTQGAYLGGLSVGTLISDIVPDTDGIRELGSTTNRMENVWTDKLVVSAGAGEGVDGDLVPATGGAYDLGNGPTYEWNDLWITGIAYIDELRLEATQGLGTDMIPTGDGAFNLGTNSLRYDNIYTDNLIVSSQTAGGVGSDLAPSTGATYDLGVSGSYEWNDLWVTGNANIDTLVLSVTEGVGGHMYPTAGDTYEFGSATYYWTQGYFNNLYYKTQATFDNADDLALIDGFNPSGGLVKMEKGGKVREVQMADLSTLPWPMLGPKDPTTGEHFMSMADSTTFLLGAIKALHSKHKKAVEIIEELQDRLKRVEKAQA